MSAEVRSFSEKNPLNTSTFQLFQPFNFYLFPFVPATAGFGFAELHFSDKSEQAVPVRRYANNRLMKIVSMSRFDLQTSRQSCSGIIHHYSWN
ncbi:MAG: hypothetical protein Q7J06_04550 [Bacteroidales bacterium]|nr:hypothetical protein [Bacteroidales bacterium]